jgi:diguanylate cyclase (GGDEF)-like protein/PAS domain S-box-containing protein
VNRSVRYQVVSTMGARRAAGMSPTRLLSNEAAQKLLEFSHDVACVVGFDGHIRQHTANWQEDPAQSNRDVAGAPFITFVHADDRQETRRRLEMLTTGAVAAIEIENRFSRLDGTYAWLSWHVTADRREKLLYCRAQDLSSRTTSAGGDVEVEARRRLDISDAVAVTDADDVLRYVSPSCRQLLGYTSTELIGKPVSRLIHPDDRALAGLAKQGNAIGEGARTVSLRYRCKDGSYAWIESKSKAIIDPLTGAVLETQALMRDIGQRKEAQESIEHQALTDALTGLANRTLLADRLNQGLRHLKRSPGFVGVLMLDLDHFKVINDTHGHHVGDAVLLEAAARLQRLARPDDTVARFGGDEFVVVVQGLADPADLTAFADRIVAGLRAPFQVGDDEVVATVSIGIAVASQPDTLAEDLLREADTALYRAKDQGRDRHEVYGAALQVRAMERQETERLVRRALAEERLIVRYQPIVELATGRTVEAEALLRIDDAERGHFSPEHFLTVAEETGLLPAMDERVRTTALRELVGWRATPSLRGVERLAVNLSARELANPQFTARLAARLHAVGLEGSDLSIEVTEHVLMQTSHSAVTSLAELRDIGVHVGLDDFGTGLTALSHLHSFPLDYVKIDRSFVEYITADARSSSIVAAIIHLAHAHDLSVVAEGVETAEQLATLRHLGCDRAQGFLFSPPVSAADFMNLLKREAA